MKFLPVTQSQSVKAVSESTIAPSARLLEIRTQAGPIYVCPSRWERMKLRWTFRNFRVLHAQVLTRSERRLVERLSRAAIVTPIERVFGNSVFGVVATSDNPATFPAQCEGKSFESRADGIPGRLTIPEKRFVERCSPGYIAQDQRMFAAGVGIAQRKDAEGAAREWVSLAVLGVVCIAAILTRASGTPTSKATYPRIPQTVLTQAAPAVAVKQPRQTDLLAPPGVPPIPK